MLSILSLIAIAVIIASLVVALSGRFLAVGSLVLANIVVHVLAISSPDVLICRPGVECDPAVHMLDDVRGVRNTIQHELGLHGDAVAGADPEGFLQLVTHMFVHGDFGHLIGNLIILLAFALPFEERIGHRLFTGLYLATGFAAAFAQMGTDWGSMTLMVGASGAVFGIIGAFAGSYPRLVVPLPIPIGIIIFVRMQVLVAAAIFGGLQLIYITLRPPLGNVAYFAHVGGLLAGLVLAATIVRSRRREGAGRMRKELDLDRFRPFAADPSAQLTLRRMEESKDEPDVFQAWLERFFYTAKCPDCSSAVAPHKHEVVCTRGHRFDVGR